MEEDAKDFNDILILIGIIIGIGLLCIVAVWLYDKAFPPKPTDENETNQVDNNDDEQSSGSEYQAYKIGDEITFKNEKWHVIKESTDKDDYVTILKDKNLIINKSTFCECEEYRQDIHRICIKSTCDYYRSVPKNYFDATYINSLGKDDLKYINGYIIRLITIDELLELGCTMNNGSISCQDTHEWLFTDNNSAFWTMNIDNILSHDNETYIWAAIMNNTTNKKEVIGQGSINSYGTRPVINLLKSAITTVNE